MKNKLKSFLIRLGWIGGIIYLIPVLPLVGILMLLLTLPMLALTAI